jgi:type II secretory pathway pseudopilin PulG
MVALLVGMAVMAVMLGALLPVWSTMARREKEAEFFFRGEQYANAISLFQRKSANANPPSVDVLITQRFLRKKYKDPITGEDFVVVTAGSALPGGAPGARGGGAAAAGSGRGAGPPASGGAAAASRGGGPPAPARGAGGGQAGGIGAPLGGGGIIGVTSKSQQKMLRIYKGFDTYNQVIFMGTEQSNRAGGPPGAAAPGGRGGAAGGRGGAAGPPAGQGPSRGPAAK